MVFGGEVEFGLLWVGKVQVKGKVKQYPITPQSVPVGINGSRQYRRALEVNKIPPRYVHIGKRNQHLVPLEQSIAGSQVL